VVARKPCSIAACAVAVLVSAPLLWSAEARAGGQLQTLNRAVSRCTAVGQPQPCPAGVTALNQLRQSPAYPRADRYCKEQITAFGRVLDLLPIQDVTDQTVQASFDGLAQACGSFGF